MRFQSNRRQEEPEINLIPLIDVLLVIIIFLMLTTTYSRFRRARDQPAQLQPRRQPRASPTR